MFYINANFRDQVYVIVMVSTVEIWDGITQFSIELKSGFLPEFLTAKIQ